MNFVKHTFSHKLLVGGEEERSHFAMQVLAGYYVCFFSTSFKPNLAFYPKSSFNTKWENSVFLN